MQNIDEGIAYKALTEGAAYVLTDSGYIQLAGPDRIDFLQRQTTNDVRALADTRSVLTVLTSPTARIIDVLWLLADDEKIVIMTVPQRATATSTFLRGKIYFMDKVTIDDQSLAYKHFDLDGPLLAEAMIGLGLSVPQVDTVTCGVINQIPVRMIGSRGLSGVGIRMVVPADGLFEVEEALCSAGFIKASREVYEIRRIEAGQPGINEMTEEYTPLEVHLDYAISDVKGCYTGQEIIARQVTYDKVTRSLVGLRLDGPVQIQQTVEFEGRNVGVVTSAAMSPRFGPIALAVLKRPHHEPRTELVVGEVRGKVVALPIAE